MKGIINVKFIARPAASSAVERESPHSFDHRRQKASRSSGLRKPSSARWLPMSQSNAGTKQTGRASRGFTLIELMITVGVIAILAAIAIPSYRQYIIRGNRSAGESVMMDIANREQQYLLANRSYADKATLTANGYTLPSDTSQNYTWAVAAGVDALSTAPIFTITFTPINGQSSDVTLTLDNQGTKTPIASWSH
jgi:type IV pilus assembly protein PilE